LRPKRYLFGSERPGGRNFFLRKDGRVDGKKTVVGGGMGEGKGRGRLGPERGGNHFILFPEKRGGEKNLVYPKSKVQKGKEGGPSGKKIKKNMPWQKPHISAQKGGGKALWLVESPSIGPHY